MIILLVTVYVIFSLAIGAGMIKHEMEINQGIERNILYDLIGVVLYPIIWPYFIGVVISKIVTSDYVLTFNVPEQQDDFEGTDDSDQI